MQCMVKKRHLELQDVEREAGKREELGVNLSPTFPTQTSQETALHVT
jgi:hypothetical protein